MKRKIGFALMGLAMLAACTQESDVNVVTEEGQDVITLGASTGTATRAAINDLEGLSKSAAGVGIYAQATTATAANTAITSEWTATPLMQNVQTTAIDATTGKMTWTTEYYYPKTAPTNVKFFAYHPYAAEGTTGGTYVKAPAAGAAPVLTFTLTGDEDLMWATPVLGSRTAPAAALKFNHQLTQMTFQLVDGDKNYTKEIMAVNLTANSTGNMNLETGALSGWGTSKNIKLNAANITMPKDGSFVKLSKTTMVQPGLESFVVSVTDTDANVASATIKPVGETTFKAGKAYLITLRLSGEVPVQLAAEVIPWMTGGTGEGIVE